MQLTSLSVRLEGYGINAGKYHGSVTFANQYGSVEIVLDESLSQKVLGLCGEALVEQAKKTANIFTANILESQKPALPAE